MSYWGATDEYLSSNYAPTCPCGRKMFAADEHGRFMCLCGGAGLDVITGSPVHSRTILQVDTAGMSDEQKAAVPPINRLNALPTTAEARLFSLLARGPDVMDTDEYQKAAAAVEAERQTKTTR